MKKLKNTQKTFIKRMKELLRVENLKEEKKSFFDVIKKASSPSSR